MRLCLLTFILLTALSTPGFSTTVCPAGCDYSVLSEAVASSPAGETIVVKAGSYVDNVVVNRSLTIAGDGDVVISPATDRLPVFYIISAGTVGIKNVRIDGKNQTCVEVEASASVSLSHLSLSSCLYGIKITDSSMVSLKNLNIISPSFGIDIKNSSSVTVEDSSIESPAVSGVTATGSENGSFRGITITPSGTAGGFYLLNSRGNTISGMRVSGGSTAIALHSSEDNTIKRSTIAGSQEGMELISSDGNQITENVVSSSQVGIYLEDSGQNRIYKNDFISNLIQAVADENANYWNTSSGNYWSDYTGGDENGDGIGDSPYVINPLNVDHLPAMAAFFTSQAQPPPAGGGGAVREDPLVEKFSELTPELMLEILDYFGVRGRVYTLEPALSAALLALEQSNIFPATGIEEVDSRLGDYAGEYADVYGMLSSAVEDTFAFSSDAVVARGDIGADALAAIAYARARNIPLLLVEPGHTPEEVKQLIQRLAVRRIVIIGGEMAVSREVEEELSAFAEVTRIYGETRVETSIRVAQATRGVRGKTEVIVIQDGWSENPEAAIVAALYEAPILYVRGKALPQATEAYLAELADEDVRVVFAGVSAQVEEQIRRLLG